MVQPCDTQLSRRSRAALVISLAGAAQRVAPTTFHAAPDADPRPGAVYRTQQPCKLSIRARPGASAATRSSLAPGTYDHHGRRPARGPRPASSVHGTPGAIRPLIEQTVPYRDCDGCPILHVYGNARPARRRRDPGRGRRRRQGRPPRRPSSARRCAAARSRCTCIGGPAGTRPAACARSWPSPTTAPRSSPRRRRHPLPGERHGDRPRRPGHRHPRRVGRRLRRHDRRRQHDRPRRPHGRAGHAGGSAGINDVATVKLRYSNYRADRLERLESDPAWPNAQLETFDNNQHERPAVRLGDRLPPGRRARRRSTAAAQRRCSGRSTWTGGARAFGAKPDIGAYEWHAARRSRRRRQAAGQRRRPAAATDQQRQQPDQQPPDDRKPPSSRESSSAGRRRHRPPDRHRQEERRGGQGRVPRRRSRAVRRARWR